MMTLQNWMESYDIDSSAGLCVALTTTGFTANKGKVVGVHLAPMWNRDSVTLLVSGADEDSVNKNTAYTGLAADEYVLRAHADKQVRAKIEELLEYCHYVVVYNKSKFFKQWIGANGNESLECLNDYPILDACNVAKCLEEGEDFSGLSFDTVFELDDFLYQRYESLKKSPMGACGFHNLVPRYVHGSVLSEPGPGDLVGDCNAKNLRTLMQELLIK